MPTVSCRCGDRAGSSLRLLGCFRGEPGILGPIGGRLRLAGMGRPVRLIESPQTPKANREVFCLCRPASIMGCAFHVCSSFRLLANLSHWARRDSNPRPRDYESRKDSGLAQFAQAKTAFRCARTYSAVAERTGASVPFRIFSAFHPHGSNRTPRVAHRRPFGHERT